MLGGIYCRKNLSRAGGKFNSSSDQLLHLVSELQERGGGRKGDLDGVWGNEGGGSLVLVRGVEGSRDSSSQL